MNHRNKTLFIIITTVFAINFFLHSPARAFAESPSSSDTPQTRTIQARTRIFGDTRIGTAQLQWNPSWFYGDSSGYTYNHDLCRVAAFFSIAAYAPSGTPAQEDHLENLYLALGFEKDSIERHYTVDYTDTEYGYDQTAFSFARLDTAQGPVVAIIVRGTPLSHEEWFSNLNIHNSTAATRPIPTGDHEGFSRSAEQILVALKQYLARQNIGRTSARYFVTGHSRGASVANMLCARLNDTLDIPGENIFAYTFAATNTTQRLEAKEPRYAYIWNIVNPEDPVPSIPPQTEGWSFWKYGTTLALPGYLTVNEPSVYTQNYLPRMNGYFTALMGTSYSPFYASHFYPYLIKDILTSLKPDVASFYKKDGKIDKTVHNALKKALPPDAQATGVITDIVADSNFLVRWFLSSIPMETCINVHRAETYFSWLAALEPEELFHQGTFTVVRFAGQVSLTITDTDGTLLAQTQNGVPVSMGSSKSGDTSAYPLPIMRLPTGAVYFALPGNQTVTLSVSDDSLFNTAMCFETHTLYADGTEVQGNPAPSPLRVNWLRGYTVKAENGTLSEPDKTTGTAALKQAWAHTDHRLKLRPGFFYDSASGWGVGLNAGTDHISALGECAFKKGHITLGAGGELDVNLTGAFYAGTQGVWRFDHDAATDEWINRPFVGGTLTYQPGKHTRVTAALGYTWNLGVLGKNADAFPNTSSGADEKQNSGVSFKIGIYF